MPSNNKRIPIPIGEYCHVYNRGVDKRVIFNNAEDFERFIESMHLFNTVDPIQSILSAKTKKGVQHLNEKLVDIVAFSILPNHFHFLLKQKTEGGISEFMKRLQGGYTNYFNEQNQRSGALFQGKYKYKHIGDDEYFRTVFCYVSFNSKIHKIPKDKNIFIKSSFNEYIRKSTDLVSKAEMKYVFEIFGNLSKIQKYANEILSIIIERRLKDGYKENKSDLLE